MSNKDLRYHIETIRTSDKLNQKSYEEIKDLVDEFTENGIFECKYDRLLKMIDDLNYLIFVARGSDDFQKESIIGVMLCVTHFDMVTTRVCLNQLSVDEKHRKKGIARLLFKAGLDYARSIDADIVELLVDRNNAAVVSIYSTFGFKQPEFFYMRKIIKEI
jgi:ribosomal protein S18 acetylase RimI-like enzyme